MDGKEDMRHFKMERALLLTLIWTAEGRESPRGLLSLLGAVCRIAICSYLVDEGELTWNMKPESTHRCMYFPAITVTPNSMAILCYLSYPVDNISHMGPTNSATSLNVLVFPAGGELTEIG